MLLRLLYFLLASSYALPVRVGQGHLLIQKKGCQNVCHNNGKSILHDMAETPVKDGNIEISHLCLATCNYKIVVQCVQKIFFCK